MTTIVDALGPTWAKVANGPFLYYLVIALQALICVTFLRRAYDAQTSITLNAVRILATLAVRAAAVGVFNFVINFALGMWVLAGVGW